MSVFRFIGDLGRLRKTVIVFSSLGFATFTLRMHLGWCMSLRCWIRCKFHRRQCPVVDLPQACRLAFEKLGPTYIKLGQILSMRPDIVPEEYIREFRKLQEHVPPFPFEVTKTTIEQELKKPLNELFATFEKEPIASASLGQVYRAFLHDGTEVAVKVQRPRIKRILMQDLRIIAFLIRKLEKHMPELRYLRPTQALQTFKESLMDEIDYRKEARNADRFAYQLREETGIAVPKIYWSHTHVRVLTMEFLRGIRMGDKKAIHEHNVDHNKVLEHCMRGCFLSIFSYGFFHADPHPGNVWILDDNRICYLDFGMMGTLDKEDRRNILLHLLFLSQEHIESAIYYLLKIADIPKEADTESYIQEIVSLVTSYYRYPKEKTATETLYDVIRHGAKCRIYFHTGMVMLAKSLMTCETMCRMTHGNMDFLKMTQPLLQEIVIKEFGPSNILKDLEKTGPELAKLFTTLPSKLENMIQKYSTKL